jgi:hypothetical protein
MNFLFFSYRKIQFELDPFFKTGSMEPYFYRMWIVIA